jgi:O-acetyl-ADP-ribose deacetylase (regulator of RNase III)
MSNLITYVKGDITGAKQSVIAHGVNCAGGFGSGVAGAIKKNHPVVCAAYLAHSPRILGTCQFVSYNNQVWVNAYTQQNYGNDGKQYADLEAVANCLVEIAEYMHDLSIVDIAIPKIGCGLGGLKWDDVILLVEGLLSDFDVYVYDL